MIRMRNYRSIFPLTPRELRKLALNIEESHNGCWNWTGYLGPGGYGRVWLRNAEWQVHKMIYELLVGPIPAGCILHHRCKNRRCCNPAHLKVVTQAEHLEIDPVHHVRRPRPEPSVPRCRKGHELTDANVLLRRDHGKLVRSCRACAEAALRRKNERRRLRRAALRSSCAPAPQAPLGEGVGVSLSHLSHSSHLSHVCPEGTVRDHPDAFRPTPDHPAGNDAKAGAFEPHGPGLPVTPPPVPLPSNDGSAGDSVAAT